MDFAGNRNIKEEDNLKFYYSEDELKMHYQKGIQKCKNGNNEITVFGDPNEKILDLVYIDDVVNAIILSTFNSNKHVFNVSTQHGISLSKLIEVIELVTGEHLKVNTLPENRNDIENKRVGDTSNLKDLGWFDNTTIIGGIRKTNDWINNL